jgi:hypothetical protein
VISFEKERECQQRQAYIGRPEVAFETYEYSTSISDHRTTRCSGCGCSLPPAVTVSKFTGNAGAGGTAYFWNRSRSRPTRKPRNICRG